MKLSHRPQTSEPQVKHEKRSLPKREHTAPQAPKGSPYPPPPPRKAYSELVEDNNKNGPLLEETALADAHVNTGKQFAEYLDAKAGCRVSGFQCARVQYCESLRCEALRTRVSCGTHAF